MMARRLALLCLLLLAAAGCGSKPPPAAISTTSPPDGTVADDVAKVSPKFTLTAEELVGEHKKDRAAAEKKYRNAVIELRGEVSGVSAGLSGDAFVSLKAGSNLLGVSCAMVDREPWASVSKGQQVTVRGVWPPSQVGVSLARCVIVARGPSPAAVLTAERLAAEYAADAFGTVNRYKGKDVIVTGVVLAREKSATGAPTIYLKGNDRVRVDCGFTDLVNDKSALESLATGQQVKVVGELLGIDHTEGSVALRFCHLVTR
jgi:hypothetical protein